MQPVSYCPSEVWNRLLMTIKIYMQHLLSLLFFLTLFLPAGAQKLTPVTRFYPQDNPATPYGDYYLSGVMQTAQNMPSLTGFLQIPYVGDPVWVYVGEKDSTQFMAYASGFRMEDKHTRNGDYRMEYTRYGVKAHVVGMPGYSVQEFVFPDTLAEKGFLIDVDHAGGGLANEDMDVTFLDKRTIRAYKRPYTPSDTVPDLYYVARFSHPFEVWNVRREVVYTKDERRERRVKAAFAFKLKPGEKLRVESAVSTVSTNDALGRLSGLAHLQKVSDKRVPLLADARPGRNTAGTKPVSGQKNAGGNAGGNASRQRPNQGSKPSQRPDGRGQKQEPEDFIEVSACDPTTRAAFYTAMSKLKQRPDMKGVKDAAAFLMRLEPLYLSQRDEAAQNAELADSLLRAQAGEMMRGTNLTDTGAARFIFHAMGFVPVPASDASTGVSDASKAGSDASETAGAGALNAGKAYRIVRPLFNVVTLHLGHGRRFMFYAKRNLPSRKRYSGATLQRAPLPDDGTFTQAQLLKGGILQVTMEK